LVQCGYGIDSIILQFDRKRRITFKWQEAMEAVLKMADLLEKYSSKNYFFTVSKILCLEPRTRLSLVIRVCMLMS